MASDHRMEWISAIVLSIAALATSRATYEAGLWDGQQAADYSQANAFYIKSANVALQGDAAMTPSRSACSIPG
jgi:hypothetical protein